MKKTEKKALRAKLFAAFKKVIKENYASLPGKAEKLLEKSVRKIVKKTSQKKNATSKAKMRTSVLRAHKYSLDGNGVKPIKQTI